MLVKDLRRAKIVESHKCWGCIHEQAQSYLLTSFLQICSSGRWILRGFLNRTCKFHKFTDCNFHAEEVAERAVEWMSYLILQRKSCCDEELDVLQRSHRGKRTRKLSLHFKTPYRRIRIWEIHRRELNFSLSLNLRPHDCRTSSITCKRMKLIDQAWER